MTDLRRKQRGEEKGWGWGKVGGGINKAMKGRGGMTRGKYKDK